MRWFVVLGLGFLTACGADGEPETPMRDRHLALSFGADVPEFTASHGQDRTHESFHKHEGRNYH